MCCALTQCSKQCNCCCTAHVFRCLDCQLTCEVQLHWSEWVPSHNGEKYAVPEGRCLLNSHQLRQLVQLLTSGTPAIKCCAGEGRDQQQQQQQFQHKLHTGDFNKGVMGLRQGLNSTRITTETLHICCEARNRDYLILRHGGVQG